MIESYSSFTSSNVSTFSSDATMMYFNKCWLTNNNGDDLKVIKAPYPIGMRTLDTSGSLFLSSGIKCLSSNFNISLRATEFLKISSNNIKSSSELVSDSSIKISRFKRFANIIKFSCSSLK